MSEIKFTSEQENAINAKGGILVSAAAGSGKTAVLVERVVRRLCDMNLKIPADRFLISTFTKDAAAEMKSRIGERIAEKTASEPQNSWYVHQKFLLDKASIGTIDSFCINLVREYFYILGVEPDFEICDELQDQTIADDVIYSMINEKLQNDDPDFAALCSVFEEYEFFAKISSVVKDIYRQLVSLPFYENELERCKKMYSSFDERDNVWVRSSLNDLKERAAYYINEFQKLEPTFLQSEFYERFKTNFYERFDFFKKTYEFVDNNDINGLAKYFSGFKPKNMAKSTDLKLESDINTARFLSTLTSVIKSIKDPDYVKTITDLSDDVKKATPAVSALCSFVYEFSKRTLMRKNEINRYTFSDIEQMALKILVDESGEPTKIAEELSDYYYEVMVDEFQDTNALQNTIFNAISDNGARLFAVGDVKQSIYRFRQADPRIFLQKKNSLAPYDPNGAEFQRCKVIMKGNFRSDGQICDFVNFVFSEIMSEKVGQMTYSDEDMLSANISLPNDVCRVRADIIETDGKDRDAEGLHIAKIITDIVGKTPIGAEGRPAKYGDIAILTKRNADIIKIANTLTKAGIPVVKSTQDSFFESREIMLAMTLLSVVDNPKNDFEMLKFLSSPLVGLTFDEITALKIKDKKSDLFSLLLKNYDENEKLKTAADMINELRTLCGGSSVSEFCSRAFDAMGLDMIVRAKFGEGAFANLMKLVSLAADFEKISYSGLSGFLSYLRRMEDSNMSSAGFDSDDDAVRLYTCHKSKGLQFPICILAHLETKIKTNRGEDRRILRSDKFGLGMKIVDRENFTKYNTLMYNEIEDEIKSDSLAEEMRLLYVALTRAKEHLIMVGEVKKADEYLNAMQNLSVGGLIEPNRFADNCQNMLSMITAAMLCHKNCRYSKLDGTLTHVSDDNCPFELNVVSDSIIGEVYVKDDECDAEFDENQVELLKERLCYEYPYAAVNDVAAKQSASRIAHENENRDYSCTAVPLFLQKKKLTAAQKGTAMHKVMQYLDIASARINLEAQLIAIENNKYLSSDEIESISRDYLVGFLNSPLSHRMENADEIYHEREFMVEMPATELDETLDPNIFKNETVVVQGAVDCAFIENGRLVIVDYKTDRVDSPQTLVDKYAIQLKVYQKALSQVFDITDSELIIYSFALSKEIVL